MNKLSESLVLPFSAKTQLASAADDLSEVIEELKMIYSR